MLKASHILAQMENDLADATRHADICKLIVLVLVLALTDTSVLFSDFAVIPVKLVSQVPDGYIPDDDLYNLRRRARKILATVGVNVSAPDASASSCPLPGDETKAEPNVPTVKIEPLDDPISLNVKRLREEDEDGSGRAGPGIEGAKRLRV